MQQGRGHHFWLTNCAGENPAKIRVSGATLIKHPARLLKESLIRGRCRHGRGDNYNQIFRIGGHGTAGSKPSRSDNSMLSGSVRSDISNRSSICKSTVAIGVSSASA
jgi:hypothetical protein